MTGRKPSGRHSPSPRMDATNPPAQRASPRGARAGGLAMLHCPNCSQRLEDRGCRLRCIRCGYFMDCSDYY